MCAFNLFSVIFVIFSVFSIEGKDKVLLKKSKYHVKQTLAYGGSRHKITDAPYMALLYYKVDSKEIFACGACIVHERFLLTAAHCYVAKHYESFVEVGTDVKRKGKKYDTEKIIVHPKYYNSFANNDIAVIKLRSKLTFDKRINLIKMAPRNFVINSGALMQTMGFGKTETANSSNHLLIIEVPHVSHQDCMSQYMNITSITDSMLCAGGVRGKSSCSGDSGGPLVYRNKLVGLVSFGEIYCDKAIPAVYARISALRSFVDYTIEEELFKDQMYKNIYNRRWW